MCRVCRKGILGIRDLTQIRCGIRENAKYRDGIRDLTAPQEAGCAKIWVRDAGCFVCLSFVKTKNPIEAHTLKNFSQNCVTFCMFPVIGWCYVCQPDSLINDFYSILQLNISKLANR